MRPGALHVFVRRHIAVSSFARQLQRFMKVVAETVWRRDEEHLELRSTPLIDLPVPSFHSARLKVAPHIADSRDEYGSSILSRIPAIDLET